MHAEHDNTEQAAWLKNYNARRAARLKTEIKDERREKNSRSVSVNANSLGECKKIKTLVGLRHCVICLSFM